MGIIGISTPPFYIYCLKMTSIEELQSAQMFFAGKYDERRVKHGGNNGSAVWQAHLFFVILRSEKIKGKKIMNNIDIYQEFIQDTVITPLERLMNGNNGTDLNV